MSVLHEPAVDQLVDGVPRTATSVLSLGAGSGEIERALLRRGHDVTVVPLDGLVADRLGRARSDVVAPTLNDALDELAGRQFDAVVMSDIIHRVEDPVHVLRGLHALTAVGGVLIATVHRPPRARRPWTPERLEPSRQRIQRWMTTAGFAQVTTASSGTRPGDDAASSDRVVSVQGSRRVPASPRPVEHPVRSMVSLGLPVFNGMPYLVESLDALRRQSYPNVEIVISDNGSTDGTEDFCRRAAAEDPRIRYFRHEVNRGAAFNYNHVFEMSRGEFFAWTAHDDLRDERNIERCMTELERLPSSVVAVASSAVFIDDAGSLIGVDTDDNSARGDSPVDRLRHVLRNVNRVNSIWGVTRAAALERTNLIGAFIGSDYVLLAELALVGEVHVIDEQLFSRRLHAEASRAANVSKRDVARWFDAGARTPVLSVKQRLAIEYLRAVNRAELSAGDRLAARAAIPVEIAVRQVRVRGGSAKQRLKKRLAAR